MGATLDFLNKNTLRKYPLRATTSGLNNGDVTIPNWLISSLTLSVKPDHRFLYVSNVVVTETAISVTIRAFDTNELIGFFHTNQLVSYNRVVMTPMITAASGILTLGELSKIRTLLGHYALTQEAGAIEPSCIFPFTPPGVISISNGGDTARGHITILGDNVAITATDQDLALSVINKATVLTNNDFHGKLANCGTPIIKSINTVLPSNTGNIDIYTINPMSITVTAGLMSLVPNLTMADVCPTKNVISPPVNASNDYYTTFSSVTTPEWLTWPNF